MPNDPAPLDAIFGAMADPTRRAVIARLATGPATVSELAAPFEMALPSFLIHLRKLETGGLIASRKQGRVRTCWLRPDALEPARRWLDAQRDVWTARLDQFDAYVTSLSKENPDGP